MSDNTALGSTATEYKHILVGLDGSVESMKALDQACILAKEHNATLCLANVIDLRAFQSISTYDAVVAEETKEGAEKLVADFADDARKFGIEDVKTRIEFGSPKLMLSQTIPDEENIDLIVLGATGLSYLERLFIGSVSQYVINHAKCDTLIVR
jgi:nucleotide-binding universal stress UspA family protein